MKQTNLAQVLLVLSIVAATLVIFYFIFGEKQIVYKEQALPIQTIPTTAVPTPDDIKTINTDYNKIDSTKFEQDVDVGLDKIGTESSTF